MPNFDGNGPLKRGRIIGRELGPCKICIEGCEYQKRPASFPVTEENARE